MAHLGTLDFDMTLRNEEFLKKLKESRAVSDETVKAIEKMMSIDVRLSKQTAGLDQNQLDTMSKRVQVEKQLLELKEKAIIASNKERDGVNKTFSTIQKVGIATAQSEAKIAAIKQGATSKELIDLERVASIRAKNARDAEAHAFRMAQAQNNVTGAVNNSNNRLNYQNKLLLQLKTAAAAYLSVWGAFSALKNIVQITGEFELQEKSLAAMVQSADQASKIFEQIKAQAVQSPFRVKDLVTYVKQLAAFSEPISSLFDTTVMLADISAGLGVSMDRLIIAYGQVRSASVLRGQELRQFTEAGIPLVNELARRFSELRGEVVSTGQVFELITKRQVPFEMIRDIFVDMTSEGGKFYKMQEIQAQTLKGKVANLRDAIDIMLSQIGDSNESILKGGIDSLRTLITNWQQVADVLKVVIAGFGSYKAALLLVNIAHKAISSGNYLSYMLNVVSGTNRATAATKAFGDASKAATAANPWLLLASVIVAVGVALRTVYRNATALQRELNKITQEGKQSAEAQIRTLDNLVERIKTTDQGTQSYRDAVSSLNRTYREFLPQQLSVAASFDEIARAADAARLAILEQAKSKAYSEGIEKISDNFAKSAKKIQESAIGTITGGNFFIGRTAFGEDKKAAEDFVSKVFSSIREGALKQSEDLSSDIWEMFFKETGLSKKDIDDQRFNLFLNYVSQYRNELKKLDEGQDNLSNTIESLYGTGIAWKEINNETERYKKSLETLSTLSMSEDAYRKTQQKIEIEHNENLLSIYKQHGLEKTQEAQTIAESLNLVKDTGIAWRDTAMEMASANDFSKMFAPTNEEFNLIDYLKRLNDEYSELESQITEYNSIDKSLVSPEDLQRLENQKAFLDSMFKIFYPSGRKVKKEDVAKTSKELTDAIKEIIDNVNADVKNYEARYDIWKMLTEVPEERRPKMSFDVEFNGEPDLIEYIKKQMLELSNSKINLNQNLMTADFSDIIGGEKFDEQTLEALRVLFEKIRDELAKDFKENESFLAKYQDYADKRVKIEENLTNDILKLTKLRTEKNSDEIDKAIAEAERLANADIAALQKDVLSKYGLGDYAEDGNVSDFFKNRIKEALPLFKSISTATLSELNKAKSAIDSMEIPSQLLIDFEKAGGDAQELLDIINEGKENAQDAIDERALNKIVDKINELTNSLGKLGSALQKFDNKILNDLGGFISSMSSGIDDISKFLKLGDKATTLDKVSLGISGISTVLDTVATSIKENEEAQREWNRAIEEGAQKMRMYQIQQLEYKEKTIFGMDNPIEPAIAAIKQYEQASKSLIEQEKKLGGGLVQVGTKKVPKGSAYAGFISGGAGIGAAVGGPVGAVVGGFLGGLAAGIGSLFGSKATTKKVPVFERLKDHYDTLFDPKTYELNPQLIADYDKLDEETKQIVDNWEEIRAEMIKADEQLEQTISDITGSIGEDLYGALIEAFANDDLDSALTNFHNRVSEILSDLAARMLFDAVFGDTLDEYGEKMKEDLGKENGQELFMQDIADLGKELEKGIPIFNEGMKALEGTFSAMGETFSPGGTAAPAQSQLSRQIAGISEETGDLLGSYINAIRGDTSKIAYMMEQNTELYPTINTALSNCQIRLVEISSNTLRSANNSDRIITIIESVVNGTKVFHIA